MKNTDEIHYEGKPSRCTAKSTLFVVSKDEWDTKEDTGKSMKKVLYVLRYVKRHLLAQSNVEQWNNQARSLSRYQVTFVWRHQSVSQSVENSLNNFFEKFRSNLLKAFWVDLKTCLGLVLPNQYCLIVNRENWGLFLGDVISWATPTPLWSLLYTTIVLYDG